MAVKPLRRAQSHAKISVLISDTQFRPEMSGWGDAVAEAGQTTFSRHDTSGGITFNVYEPVRVQLNWFMWAAGLGNANMTLRRVGDIDGPTVPFPPIFEQTVSSYIEPIQIDDITMFTMRTGRWRVSMFSTHQAMNTKKGFMNGFARGTFEGTWIDLGDVDGSGNVDLTDLLDVIASWGLCGSCAADVTGDGYVDTSDLLQVIADWSG